MRMEHGLMKHQYPLIVYDERKVQTLLESHPKGSVRKDLKYLMQCVHGWDLKHPTKIGPIPPHHRRHILGPRICPFHRDMPPANRGRGSAETP